MMVAIVYGAGSLVTLGVIFGANAWANELDREEPFGWGDVCEDGPVIRNIVTVGLWPIAAVVYVFIRSGRALARRKIRRIESEKERKKWLEAKLPE